MSYTVTASTSVVLVTTSSNTPPSIVYLPNISTVGRLITVRDNDGFASLTSSIVLSTTQGITFADGTTSAAINQPFGFITLNSLQNGNYAIVNSFAFSTQAAATVSNLTTNTLQMIDASTQALNSVYASNSHLYINSTLLGEITTAQLTSTVNGLGSAGYISTLTQPPALQPLWVSVGGRETGGSVPTIRYSTNGGLTWSNVDNGFSNATNQWTKGYAITYGGGKFVAVGYPNTPNPQCLIKYSADGIHWNNASNTFSDWNSMRCCAYGNGMYLVGGYTAFSSKISMYYSYDAIVWSVANVPLLYNTITDFAYGNGVWVAANNVYDPTYSQGPEATMLWSLDGINWSNASTASWRGLRSGGVVFDGTKFICTPDSGANSRASNVAYSYDGSNWTSDSIIAGNFQDSAFRIAVATPYVSTQPPGTPIGAISATLLVTTCNATPGQGLWYSFDGGFHWSNDTTFSNVSGYFISKPYYDGAKWWVGYASSNSTAGQRMFYSMDGKNWSSQGITNGFSNNGTYGGLTSIAPSGFISVYSASNANPQVISTVVGLQQTFQTNLLQTSSLQVNSILGTLTLQTSSITQWVAAGVSSIQQGTLQTSSDGSNWFQAVSGGFPATTPNGGYGIVYNGTRWVATGNAGFTKLGSIQTSTDGSNWSSNVSGGFAGQGFSVATNGFTYMAGGENYTALGSLQYSSDGTNWLSNVSGGFPTGGGCRSVAWNGAYWLATGFGGSVAANIQYSYDGSNWTNSTSGGFTTNGTGVAWNGNVWVATGNGGSRAASIKTSSDGLVWSSAVTGGFTTQGNGIAWNGFLWVAVGTSGSRTSNIQRSYDGLNWLNAITGGFTTQGNGVAWNGSVWVAVGTDSSSRSSIQVSTDGANWTPILSGGFTAGNAVAFSKNSALVPDIIAQNLNFYLSGQPDILTATTKHQIRTSGSLLNLDYTMFINKNTNRVGINTQNPQASLDVVGSVAIQGSLAVSTIVSIQSVSSITTLTGYGDLYYNPTNRTIGYSNTLH